VIVRLQSCAVSGTRVHAVQTEVHLIQGAKFHLVGLPDSAMKEAAHDLPMALGILGASSQCPVDGLDEFHYG
jgi:hypothetical protein